VYAGSAQIHAVIEDSHAKQRVLCELLVAYMLRKSGGAQLQHDSHTPSSKASKEKQLVAHDAKERVDTLYIYSIPSACCDMFMTSARRADL
jgi:hypothetical protein